MFIFQRVTTKSNSLKSTNIGKVHKNRLNDTKY